METAEIQEGAALYFLTFIIVHWLLGRNGSSAMFCLDDAFAESDVKLSGVAW